MNLLDKIRQKQEKEISIIKKYGGYDIESYTLISNVGYTFKIGNYSYDARHWRNCYGCDVNYWSVRIMNVYSNEYDDNIKSIEIELNKLIREEVI